MKSHDIPFRAVTKEIQSDSDSVRMITTPVIHYQCTDTIKCNLPLGNRVFKQNQVSFR